VGAVIDGSIPSLSEGIIFVVSSLLWSACRQKHDSWDKPLCYPLQRQRKDQIVPLTRTRDLSQSQMESRRQTTFLCSLQMYALSVTPK